MSQHWNDEEYAYEPCSDSYASHNAGEELADMMEWAENEGLRRLITTREGANFVQYGELWLIALYGGQPIHHDRHISEMENGSHDTWNVVCSGEGDQLLVTEVAQDMFNHMPLTSGSGIYLNTTNRHLVSRNEGAEICVMLQIQGYGPDDREEALNAMVKEWRQQTRRAAA